MFGKESLRGAIYIYPEDVEESEALTGTNVVRDRERHLYVSPKGSSGSTGDYIIIELSIHRIFLKNIHGDIIHQEYRNIKQHNSLHLLTKIAKGVKDLLSDYTIVTASLSEFLLCVPQLSSAALPISLIGCPPKKDC